jgi:hypothetical protein
LLLVLEVFVAMTTPAFYVPPLAPFSTETDKLSFRTDESWTAFELSGVLQGLEGTYATFLLARHLAVAANQRKQQLGEEYERYLRLLEREGPHFDILVHEWLRFIRRVGPTGTPFMFPFGPISVPALESSPQSLGVEIDYYQSRPDEFMSPAQELVIDNIQMASPGGFSLRGLGEPLREIREFIKDLWYRNRQERERGELEILKEKLALVTQNNLAPAQIQILAVTIADGNQDLKALLESGKLALDGEEPKGLEKPKTTRQRRPRRQRPAGESSS